MTRAIVLMHAEYEGPGRLAGMLEALGWTVEVRGLHLGAPVPERLAADELLVVMGGAMGVADVDDPAYPFLRRELALLERCIAEAAPVIGICLGAQLLAAAAGARVAPMRGPDGARCYEVGWAPVDFQVDAPVLAGLPARAPMLHWHGDACELPAGAHRLASTGLCANQAFRIGARGFGLQFHPELDAGQIEDFIREDAEYAKQANGRDAAEQIRRETQRYLAPFLELTERLLGNVLRAMTAPRNPQR